MQKSRFSAFRPSREKAASALAISSGGDVSIGLGEFGEHCGGGPQEEHFTGGLVHGGLLLPAIAVWRDLALPVAGAGAGVVIAAFVLGQVVSHNGADYAAKRPADGVADDESKTCCEPAHCQSKVVSRKS